MNILLLRFDALMVSFGSVCVDSYAKIADFPSVSMLTGLIGNALGYDHSETKKLAKLQSSLDYAVRCDVPGVKFTDFQIVNLKQPHMSIPGWTTRDYSISRAGDLGKGKEHFIYYRDYFADSLFTVAVALKEQDGLPSMDEIEHALNYPERPLFLGRKCCLPARQIVLGRADAPSLVKALIDYPCELQKGKKKPTEDVHFWWLNPKENETMKSFPIPIVAGRDWENNIHVGQRMMYHGSVSRSKLFVI